MGEKKRKLLPLKGRDLNRNGEQRRATHGETGLKSKETNQKTRGRE